MKIIINGEAVEVGGSGVEGSVSVIPVTDSEYQALTDAEKNTDDKAWLVTDVSNASGGSNDSSSSGEVYSTEETRIGTWINGKPLYRKTYRFTSQSSIGQSAIFSVEELKIDELISCTGSVKNTTNSTRWPLNVHTVELTVSGFISSTSFFFLYITKDYALNSPGNVTFLYTKTTD